ncbi:hypothetical protein ABI59_00055 [Acidobacteria bacterium Mor1]|nr:hypothetical protein ABI59_00055 [Acidobacteria bacterium Mor1]
MSLRTVFRRAAASGVTLLLVTALVFGLVSLTQTDPIQNAEDEVMRGLSPEWIAELRALYHLDRPVHERYLRWLGDLAQGDLGRSLVDRRQVADKIAERLPPTLLLGGCSLALMLLVSVPLGTLAAYRPGSWFDRLSAGGVYALYSLPSFWAALLLQILFAVRLGWLPLYGLHSDSAARLSATARFGDLLAHLVLPVIVMSYGGVAYLSRFVRANLLENLGADSARAARARGLSSWSVLLRHGFRQAAVPLLTLAGFLLPSLVGGSVIVENVFSIPGLGQLFVQAVFDRDLPTVMALTLLSGLATLAGIFLADLAYTWFDPRTREQR